MVGYAPCVTNRGNSENESAGGGSSSTSGGDGRRDELLDEPVVQRTSELLVVEVEGEGRVAAELEVPADELERQVHDVAAGSAAVAAHLDLGRRCVHRATDVDIAATVEPHDGLRVAAGGDRVRVLPDEDVLEVGDASTGESIRVVRAELERRASGDRDL